MKLRSLLALSLICAGPALAEVELSFYTGFQTSPHSKVTGNDPLGAGAFDFTAGWEGNSFAAPPYYGVRAMWWRSENFGIGLDFTHSKAYGDDETLAATGFEVLEFTDGLNNLTVNAAYRWPNQWGKFTPYAGGGIGIIIPHAEIKSNATVSETQGYQFGGLSATVLGGVSYDINEKWAAFGEYKFTYSALDVDIDGGGSLQTDIITNALNIGLSYRF